MLSISILFSFIKDYLFCLLPFLISFILAFFIHNVAKKTAYFFSVKITSILYFMFMIIILSWIIVSSSHMLISFLKQLLINFPVTYNTKIIPIFEMIEYYLQIQIDIDKLPFLPFILDTLKQFSYQLLQTLISNINSLIFFFPNIIITCFMIFFSLFLILLDYDKILLLINQYLPKKALQHFHSIKTHIYVSLIHLFSVSLKCSCATFIISLIGLKILGHSHSFWMALALALLDGIPLVGTSLILLPWMVFEFLFQRIKIACGLALLSMILMLVHTVMENHLLSHKTGIPPFLFFMAIMISQRFFGIIITLFVPLLLFIIQDILKNINQIHTPDSNTTIE